jgi:hypothetical protein
LGPNIAAASTNFLFLSNGTSISYVNVPTGGSIYLSFQGSFGTAGSMTVNAATGLTWSTLTTVPTLSQTTHTTDVATSPLTLRSQAPWASATGANRNPGNVIVEVPSPAAGGSSGKVSLVVSGTERAFVDSAGLSFVTKHPILDSATYTVPTTRNGRLIIKRTSGTTTGVTLPASPLDQDRLEIKFHETSTASVVTLTPSAGTVGGGTTMEFSALGTALVLVYDSTLTDWMVMA